VKRTLVLFGALAMALVMAVPALAITKGGTPDGDDHPYVGLSIYFAENELGDLEVSHRCSGTLISPTVYVTAGHCTFGMDKAMLWFADDVQTDQGSNGYPDFSDPDDDYYPAWGAPGHTVTGTPHTYDPYVDAAFFLYDLGVIVLDEPVIVDSYASLGEAGDIDELGDGRNRAGITAVGYGLQNANKNHTQADKVRMQADLFVVNTKGVAGIGNLKLPEGWLPTNSVILSGDAKHGGTCFGDSGGPGLIEGDTLVAVNSFGLNGNCAGIGGMFRIDRQDEIDWISDFLSP